MTWKSEAKQMMQSHYGGYCEVCKQLNITPVPYHSFTMDIYEETIILRNVSKTNA